MSLLLTAAPISAPQRLAEARRQMDDLHYDKAVRAAEAGLLATDIDHQTLVGLYTVAAVSWAALDKPAKAKEAFERLLSVNPSFELSRDLPPRTRTPFFEAKTWLSQTTPVSATVTPVVVDSRLVSLDIVVTDNELLRVTSARITLTPVGGAPETEPLRLEDKKASITVHPGGTAWRIELLGDRGVLADLTGTASKAEPPPPPPPVVTVPPPPTTVVAAPAPSTRWARTVGWVTAIGAGLAAAGGAGAAVVSVTSRNAIVNAARNDQNVVTGITQVEASRLDAQARLMATLANGLFVAAGVLGASAVIFFVVGADSPQPVAVSVGPSGLWASVHF